MSDPVPAGEVAWKFLDDYLVQQVGGYLMNTRTGPGFCHMCRLPIDSAYEVCPRCNGSNFNTDAISFLAYGTNGSQSSRLFYGYKDPKPATGLQGTISIMTALALLHHAACLENGLPFTHYAVVPSTKVAADQQPLQQLVSNIMKGSYMAPKSLKRVGLVSAKESGRIVDVDRFTCEQLTGANVLLIDDAWVTGANVQSCASRMKQNGAVKVTALVLARWLNPAGWEQAKAFLDQNRPMRGFDPNQCPTQTPACH